MTDTLKIYLAQLNPTLGDIEGNLAKIRAARVEAAAQGADLLVASEMYITGYPAEDLVLKPMFLDRVDAAIEALAADTADGGPGLLIGAPWREDRNARAPLRGKVFNAAVLIDGGEVLGTRFKHELPNYGVFDEVRLFSAGALNGPMNFRNVRLGVMVCEDMWFPEVSECLAESGAEILICINGSPYELNKEDERLQLGIARVLETELPLVYVNQVGGQDELVFDGGSYVLSRERELRIQMAMFEQCIAVLRI